MQGASRVLALLLIILGASSVSSFLQVRGRNGCRGRWTMREQIQGMNEALKRRVDAGTITANDLERAFGPNKKEIDRLSLSSSHGFSTIIFGLEGCLVDIDTLYYKAYSMIASAANLQMPSKEILKDCIGSSFRESISAFGWDLPSAFESNFYDVLEKLMEQQAAANAMTIQPGAVLALERCIQDENTIIINTALPRRLATKCLGITQLSTLLAAHVNPENLIHTVESERNNRNASPVVRSGIRGTSVQILDGRLQLLRCCAQARSAPMLCLLVDVNRNNLLHAKRIGVSTMGLSGYAINKATLRSCDKILQSLFDFKIGDAYSIIRRHVGMLTGRAEATASSATLVPPESSRRRVASPAQEDPKAIKDSFAEDSKSPDVL